MTKTNISLPEKATDDINMIFHKAAITAELIKQKRKPVKRQNAEKWFDQEYKTIRKDLRKITIEKHLLKIYTKTYQ